MGKQRISPQSSFRICSIRAATENRTSRSAVLLLPIGLRGATTDVLEQAAQLAAGASGDQTLGSPRYFPGANDNKNYHTRKCHRKPRRPRTHGCRSGMDPRGDLSMGNSGSRRRTPPWSGNGGQAAGCRSGPDSSVGTAPKWCSPRGQNRDSASPGSPPKTGQPTALAASVQRGGPACRRWPNGQPHGRHARRWSPGAPIFPGSWRTRAAKRGSEPVGQRRPISGFPDGSHVATPKE